MSLVNLFHWLLIGPLFIYIGIMKENTPSSIYTLLFTMGAITIIYHFYRWFNSINRKPLIKSL